MFESVAKFIFIKFLDKIKLESFLSTFSRDTMEGLYYPDHGDPAFQQKIGSMAEFQEFRVPDVAKVANISEYEQRVAKACGGFEKAIYQQLVQHYLSYQSPYRGILLFHGLGVGKTCSAITIAEALLQDDRNLYTANDPPVWVVLPTALHDAFESQICQVTKLMDPEAVFDQCTGDTYKRMVHSAKDEATMTKKVEQLIKQRYKLLTYEGFASEVAKRKDGICDKVIIVDEAHNLRVQESDKRAANALIDVAKLGVNNRIILLSATPMYNDTDEIFWLLSVLTENDKRIVLRKLPTLYNQKGERNESVFKLLKQLASEYISYIRGTNPFTFAARLSPAKSGVTMYQEDSNSEWLQHIRDGLVPTEMSDVQRKAITKLSKSDAILHQANNICFPGSSGVHIGRDGFNTVFTAVDDADPIQVKYKKGYEDTLCPDDDHLGKYGPKLKSICDLIAKTDGIVVVYSQFVWGGIVPLACALEHMGFERYGTRNMIKNPKILQPEVRYPGIPFPKYCILSGDPKVMKSGKHEIDRMVAAINHPNNLHGENVKVVLMSPVAGEGLSLRNVREVHIMDPWYHLNKLDQVIGRAIRTCSHTALPLEERNVTVFLHVATNTKKESTDIHSYKIAARKAKQMDEVESIIRDASMDCSLLQNVNYFPKGLFGFDLIFKTSRGAFVPFTLGDDEIYAPKCNTETKGRAEMIKPKEAFRHLIPLGIQRLRKHIKSHSQEIFFPRSTLLQVIGLSEELGSIVLYNATKGGILVAHRDGFVIVNNKNEPSAKRVLLVSPKTKTEENKGAKEDTCQIVKVFEGIPVDQPHVATLMMYLSMDSKCWRVFAKEVCQHGIEHYHTIKKHISLLAKQGCFVRHKELPKFKNPGKMEYIGFVDIFDKSNFTLYDQEKGSFRDATESEVVAIKKDRQEVTPPVKLDALYGALEAKTSKKDEIARFDIKLYVPGPNAEKRRGVVCTSTKKGEMQKNLESLGVKVDIDALTKEQICFTLALELLQRKRLYLLPTSKPV